MKNWTFKRLGVYDTARAVIATGLVLSLATGFLDIATKLLRENDKTARKLREINRIVGEKEVKFDEETKNNLKSLGYLQ